jgi:hypothetical protein
MEQGTLRFGIKQGEISDSVLQRCKDLRAAIRLCIETSGRQVKEIAFDLNINKDHLSRMINASDDPRHFPCELLNDLMTVCGNEIPLRWQALSKGYGLFRLKTELELANERLEQENEELRKEMETMLKIVKQIRS